MRKTLCALVLGAAALLTSCDPGKKYEFKGELGDEKVEFYNDTYMKFPSIRRGGFGNVLVVKTQDGKTLNYVDLDNDDLQLEYFVIQQGGQRIIYGYENSTERPVLERAQKKFDAYLEEIEHTKKQRQSKKVREGLEILE